MAAAGAPIEFIEWRDSFGLPDGWRFGDELEGHAPLTVVSVGTIIREDDDCVLIAGSWSLREDPQYGGAMAIPKCSIVKRRRLR